MRQPAHLSHLERSTVLACGASCFFGVALNAAMTTVEAAAVATAIGACLGIVVMTLFGRRRFAAERRNYHDVMAVTGQLECDLRRDSLTGLLNRSAFKNVMQSLIEGDGAGGMIMLTFFDLNRFKEVNDTLGHEAGDVLLRQVAERVVGQIDDALAICRMGGDEFAAITSWDGNRDPQEFGRSLVDTIAQPFVVGDRLVEVGASVGIAIGDPAVQGGDELLRRADLAMYEAKTAGGHGYHIYDDLLSNRQMRANSIRVELGQSMLDDSLVMHYQPIVNARTGKIEKAEALLRAKFGPLSGVSPSLMVSVAEDSGQIVKLTDWTLDCALVVAQKIDMPIAVNISPVYFRHPDFPDRMIDKILSHGCNPASLIVEVTEGVLISDLATARASIEQLREVGIGVYLDDFGTGYSSLSYLQNFDLDGLKLDRSFLQDLGRQEKARRIIKSMIDFSHSLDLAVVMEGIEAEWQARILQLMGCDFMQGYELGVPMAIDELMAIIVDNHRCDLPVRISAANG